MKNEHWPVHPAPASIRVLRKAGFAPAGEESFDLPDGGKLNELVYKLERQG